MTWRTTLYLLTVLLAATAVATTALSDAVQPAGVNSPAVVVAAATMEEHARRTILMGLGSVLLLITYRRAFSNLLKKA
jgi:hypothetical protein